MKTQTSSFHTLSLQLYFTETAQTKSYNDFKKTMELSVFLMKFQINLSTLVREYFVNYLSRENFSTGCFGFF
jgi:hypothetical protein